MKTKAPKTKSPKHQKRAIKKITFPIHAKNFNTTTEAPRPIPPPRAPTPPQNPPGKSSVHAKPALLLKPLSTPYRTLSTTATPIFATQNQYNLAIPQLVSPPLTSIIHPPHFLVDIFSTNNHLISPYNAHKIQNYDILSFRRVQPLDNPDQRKQPTHYPGQDFPSGPEMEVDFPWEDPSGKQKPIGKIGETNTGKKVEKEFLPPEVEESSDGEGIAIPNSI